MNGSPLNEIHRLRDLTPQQWKGGTAAVLGWLFDGLDMHLYTLVASPFVAELLQVERTDTAVGRYGSIIQAAFLIGWAIGGGFFGVVADRLGRSRALVLTILTYACFTGLSFCAQTWWHLLIFRFLAALGIGGEWAVGASLLSETWPKRWRPWLAAVLQSGVNVGVILACGAAYLLAEYPPRYVFLVGILPAFLVLWIRRAVPETEEWHAAQTDATQPATGIRGLFAPEVRRTTWLTLTVCSLALTAHWAYMNWCLVHMRRLPPFQGWDLDAQNRMASQALLLIMCMSIVGNFLAGGLALWIGYRRAIVGIFLAYFLSILLAYGVPRDGLQVWAWLIPIGLSQGVFALFTMYLPPLFPTLIRSTGAGFCYNIGRIAAAIGTVVFGLFTTVQDYRYALFYAGWLFLPAAAVALLLKEPDQTRGSVAPMD